MARSRVPYYPHYAMLSSCHNAGLRYDGRMTPSRLCLLAGLASLIAPAALADRYSDYWAPENMAKRQCASVHINYLPTLPAHTAAYNEMVIEKSAPGTYFASNNFSGGYIGVQETVKDGKPHYVAIFSIWDAKDSGDNPHAAPESERAQLIQKGPHVTTRRFGGEGTGGNSMRPFDWKIGQVIRTLVIEKPDGEDFRQMAGYIYDEKAKQWQLMSCWRVQALRRGLGGGTGFVEDFRRDVKSKELERRATFGPAYRYLDGKWHQANQFRFTKDGNPNMEINCRMNPKLGFYSLATGGKIAPEKDFPVWSQKTIEKLPASTPPGAAVQALIDAPLMQKVDYSAKK